MTLSHVYCERDVGTKSYNHEPLQAAAKCSHLRSSKINNNKYYLIGIECDADDKASLYRISTSPRTPAPAATPPLSCHCLERKGNDNKRTMEWCPHSWPDTTTINTRSSADCTTSITKLRRARPLPRAAVPAPAASSPRPRSRRSR